MTSKKHTSKRVLVLPDAHFPFHSEKATACVLHVAQVWRPDEIVILGDWLDGAAFSSHPRRSFAERAPAFVAGEVAPCNAYLDKLQGRSHRPLVYCEGNHEARVERYATGLGDVGADLYSLLSPRRLIEHRVDATGRPHSQRRNFTWVPYMGRGVHSHYQITRRLKHSSALIAVHGWSTAKDAARVHLDLARDTSVVFGHVHRALHTTSRNRLTGEILQAWSPGCLADLVPPYTANSPSDWTHGFSLVYVGRDSWMSYNVPIFADGSAILPDGRRVVG